MNPMFSFLPMSAERLLLLTGTIVLAVSGIVLQNTGVLPLTLPTFLFFSFLLLLCALYRPAWMFLLFIGMLPLEIVDLTGTILGGLTLRPYQWLTGILLLAVAIRFTVQKLPFALFRPFWFDSLPVLVAVGAFLSAWSAPDQALSLKQAVVVTSFVAVYFLGRIFLRTLPDVKQALPFFLSSTLVVMGYALWQNLRFLAGQESFQVMAGRPNATFSEADWLGLFLVLMLGVGLFLLAKALLSYQGAKKQSIETLLPVILALVYLVLVQITLVLTVARSAWLGSLVLVVTFFLGLLFVRGTKALRDSLPRTLWCASFFLLSSLLALGSVHMFKLTSFQLLNRVESTTSGLQTITLACDSDQVLPEKIVTMEELGAFGCRHIPLEAIETEKQAGKFVKEIARDDPNIALRQEIYGRVWTLLREHPLLGIGWGSVTSFLGTDERGAGLNASNMFLEVWLGSGLLGLGAFLCFWGFLTSRAFSWYHRGESEGEQLFGLFLLAVFLGVMVCNLFNSGILLGWFFLLLALGALAAEKKFTKTT